MAVVHKILLKCDRCGREETFEQDDLLDEDQMEGLDNWNSINLDSWYGEYPYLDAEETIKYLCPACSDEYDKLTRTFIKHPKLTGLIFSDSNIAHVMKW